jgi:ATP-binding cassette subfamily B protein
MGLAEYRRVLGHLRPYRGRLALVVATGLFATLLGLAQPYISKLLIDEALLKRDWNALLWVAGLMLAITAAGFGLNILSSYRYVEVSAAVLFDMRSALYQHLQRLSPRFYTRTRLGDIVSRLNNDIAEVQRVSSDALLALLSNLVFLIGSAAVMIWLEWRLFLVSVAALPWSALALRHYQKRFTGRVRTVRERSAEIGSFLIETLQGMRLVVTSAAERHEVERFRERNRRFVAAILDMQLASYLAGAAPGAILTLSTAALFLYGGKLVIDGALSIGSLVAILAYHLRLLGPVQNLMALHTNLVAGAVSLQRIFELADARPEVIEPPDAAPLGDVRGEITFENVTFRHDRDTPLLESVSFHLPAGASCAIVGPSGSGKSTLADLILRLYDPESGRVLLDGHDLRSLRLEDLRRAVALVEQTPYLFHASIRENITYARPDASQDDIMTAARAASIHDFIASLPEGYETVVGERGMALSAGERQRLAIARALLRDPKVLVLDEPTAALDEINEQAVARLLRSGRTVVLITHRPALAALADRVVEPLCIASA